MTKAQRTANRQYAMRHMDAIRKLCTRVDINDVHGSHVTVRIYGRRIEWWPGANRWASKGPKTAADNHGSFHEFEKWLSDQDGHNVDDFCVIE